MSVEPITTVSGKSVAPLAPARIPSEQKTIQKDKEVQTPVKGLELHELEELAADVQNNLNIMHNVDLQFSVHEPTGQLMVTVIEQSTGKVIKEIPPIEVLELAAKINEMVGMLFDQKG